MTRRAALFAGSTLPRPTRCNLPRFAKIAVLLVAVPVTARHATAALLVAALVAALVAGTGPAAGQCVDYADYLHPVARIETAGAVRDVVVDGNRVFVAEQFAGLHIFERQGQDADTLATYAFEDLIEGMVYDHPHLYVAARAQGLVVLDVSDPDDPVLVDEIATSHSVGGLDLHGGLVFLAQEGFGVTVIDASHPDDLRLAGSLAIDGGARALVADFPFLHVANQHGVLVIDILDSARPTPLGHLPLEDGAYSLAQAGDRLFVGGRNLHLVSITQPQEPTLIASDASGSIVTSVRAAGPWLYVTDYEDGLAIYDISGGGTPVPVSQFPTLFAALVLAYEGSQVYIGDTSGLGIYETANPERVEREIVIDLGGEASDILFADPYAYVADATQGLLVLDVREPASPFEAGRVEVTGGLDALVLDGQLLYSTGPDVGLLILDVGDPLDPDTVSRLPFATARTALTLDGDLALIACHDGHGTGSIQIIDVGDPSEPQIQRDVPFFFSYPTQTVLGGQRLFASSWEDGLVVLDYRDRWHPVISHTLPVPGKSRGLLYDEDRVFLISGRTLQIIDVTEDTAPVVLGQTLLPSVATGLDVRGYHAYVSTAASGVQVIDVRDPARPVLVGAAPSGPSTTLTLREDELWVGCAPQSLQRYPAQCYEGDLPLPGRTDLHVLLSPRPNPFRHEAGLGFDLPAPADVDLSVYDLNGRRIIQLAHGLLPAGPQRYLWDGRTASGLPAAAGFYFVRLAYDGQVESRRLIRLR